MAELNFYIHVYADSGTITMEELGKNDVAPVRYGQWETAERESDGLIYRVDVCSECNHTKPVKRFPREDYAVNYCPNCGAKMEN